MIFAFIYVGYASHTETVMRQEGEKQIQSEQVELKKENTHLKKRLSTLFVVLENYHYPVMIWNHTGVIIQWNDAMEKLTGIPSDKVVESTVPTLFVCKETPIFNQAKGLTKVFDENDVGDLITFHCVLHSPSGDIPVFCSVRVSSQDDDSKPLGVCWIQRTDTVKNLDKPSDDKKTELRIEKEVDRRVESQENK